MLIKSSYAGGCSPSTTTGTCATTTTLTVGAACISQTTCDGSAPNAAGSGDGKCSWSKFVATSANMILNIDVTNAAPCYITSQVYSSTGVCSGLTQISSSSGTPMDDAHYLNNLVVGQTYYVEVCEPQFGPCKDEEAVYCISVAPYTPCNTCSSPCGAASGFATTPTVAQVTAACSSPNYSPVLQPTHNYTFCNTFVAVNTTVSFNVIISSTGCSGGNVTGLTWSLYNYPSCGAAIQTGNLSNLTFTGLTVGNSYNFCYTFGVPNGCYHTRHCPFYVGAFALPVTLTYFDGNYYDKKVNLNWVTETEINNDFFTIERSIDMENFEVIGVIKGNGNSNSKLNYTYHDNNPKKGIFYYRLKQTDFDGNSEYFNPISVEINSTFYDFHIFPNPISGYGHLEFTSSEDTEQILSIFDISGRKVFEKNYLIKKGNNNLTLETTNLSKGMYFVKLDDGAEGINIKFIKE